MKFKYLLIIVSLILFAPGLVSANGNLQALYEQGMEAFKSGNYGSSELLLRKIVETDGTEYKDNAWYYMALSIFNQKKYTSAIFEFNRFLSSCTNKDLCSLARYWIAESYYLQNDYIRAIQEFNRFIAQTKINEYDSQAYDRIGRIYFIQLRYDEAIIEWTKALEKCSDQIKKEQIRLNIGEAYFLNENYDEAINFLTPLLTNNDIKTASMARLITGRAYQLKNKNTQALKIFSAIDEKLLTEYPYNEVQYFRGLSYIAIGNFNFAILHLKSFLSIGKDSKWLNYAKYELAKIYLKDNNTKDATELLEDIKKSKANTVLKSSASLELGKIYFDPNIEESIKCLKEASASDSVEMKKEALLLLSKAYIKIKNFKEAKYILEQLITNYSFDKDKDLFHFMLATVYLEDGDFEKTINEFNTVKELNPFSKYINESYYYLAIAQLRTNNTEEAVDLLNKYINLPKTEKKYDAYKELLDLYIAKQNFKNADKIVTIIIDNYIREKGVEEILYKYGMALSNNNKSGKPYFSIILTKFSKSEAAGKVLLSLGDEAFIKKNYKEAEYYYRQYLSVQWRDNAASVYLYRIISLHYLERYKEIINILGIKESIPPMNEFTAKQLSLWSGRSYYKSGDYKKAYESYSTWRLTDLAEEDLLNMVKCTIKNEDIFTAKRAIDLIQKNKTIHAEAQYELSQYYISINNYDAAGEYLLKIISENISTEIADSAKADSAEILTKKEKFDDAVLYLKEIKSEKIQNRKNALLIIAYFKTGNGKEASDLTQKNNKDILKSAYAEMILKENLLYYYSNNNQNLFYEYAQYLAKFPGNNLFINYLTAKLNFNNKNYKTSYYYFYKLSDVESEYKNEANYYLGLISLLNNRDTNLALKYFKKISENSSVDNKYIMQGKIELSLLAIEVGNAELSRKMLSEIIKNSDNRLLRIQAENLIDYFGYEKEGLKAEE